MDGSSTETTGAKIGSNRLVCMPSEWCSRDRKGVVYIDTCYFITSLTDMELFAKVVRKHWGIENSLHWYLDMTFHEDYSRMRKDHSTENMTVVRHMALNLLKRHPFKMSLVKKRRHCSYDEALLAEVLSSVHVKLWIKRWISFKKSLELRQFPPKQSLYRYWAG